MKLPPLGTLLDDRYELHCLITEGGQAMVYRGRDSVSGGSLAIKLMRDVPDMEAAETVRQFCMEYEVLKHPGPGLPLAHALTSYEGRPVIVEDWVEGLPVDGLGTSLPLQRAVMVAAGVLRVLDHLHQRTPPVVVRDIKPDNLLLQDSEVYLVDLSGCRLYLGEPDEVPLGTGGFAAPEQYEGRSEPASDLFAVGAVLQFLLTGHEGWIRQLPCSPQEYRNDIPPALEACVRRATAADPAHRFATAAEMSAALQRAVEDFGTALNP